MKSTQSTQDLTKNHNNQVTNQFNKSEQRNTKNCTQIQTFRHRQTTFKLYILRESMRSTLAKRTKNSTAKLKKKILDSSLQAAGGSIGNFQDHKTSSTIRLILFSRKWFFQEWVHHLCSNSLPCTFLHNNFSPNPTYPRLFISNRHSNPSNNFNMSKTQWWIRH